VGKREKFTAYVDKLLFGESRSTGVVAAIVASVVSILTPAGLNIWGEYGRIASRNEKV
jgi:hypothetical protein